MRTLYFCPVVSSIFLMVALCNRADHYIFALWFDYNFQWMTLASQFESCVAVCSRSSWAWQFLEHISQGRITTRLRCGEIFKNHSTAHLLTNQPVKEFWESVKIWRSYRHEFGGLLFGTQCGTVLVYCCVCFSFVTDSVCAVTISLALFILPARKPNYLCFRQPNGVFPFVVLNQTALQRYWLIDYCILSYV